MLKIPSLCSVPVRSAGASRLVMNWLRSRIAAPRIPRTVRSPPGTSFARVAHPVEHSGNHSVYVLHALVVQDPSQKQTTSLHLLLNSGCPKVIPVCYPVLEHPRRKILWKLRCQKGNVVAAAHQRRCPTPSTRVSFRRTWLVFLLSSFAPSGAMVQRPSDGCTLTPFGVGLHGKLPDSVAGRYQVSGSCRPGLTGPSQASRIDSIGRTLLWQLLFMPVGNRSAVSMTGLRAMRRISTWLRKALSNSGLRFGSTLPRSASHQRVRKVSIAS